MTDRKIITDYWAKPIPPRQFDWTAWFDGEEGGNVGYGRTEADAIADLKSLDDADNSQFGVGA